MRLFAEFGFKAQPRSPKGFEQLARAEGARQRTVIKTSSVQLD